jgi:lipoprotein-anchoring transpeptidase ErfK/SrfK
MKPNTKFQIAAIGATNASQLTASIDCRGFSFARILCISTGNPGLSTVLTNNTLEDSDNNSTWSPIAAAAAGTAYTPSSVTVATTEARLIYEVDLRGRKRYLKPTFTLHATTQPIIAVELGLAADAPVTAAQNGAAHLADI